ncbi:hypothetical protein B0A49_11288, partial [Cryomyces minteri]
MQWVAVPIVVGHFTAMGDAAENAGRLPSDPQRASLSKNHGQSTPPASVGLHPESSDASEQPYGSEAPFYSQYSSIPPSQRNVEDPRYTAQQGPASYPRPSVQDQSGPSFDMSFVAGALPDLRHQQSRLQNQQAMTGASAPALVYQLQQNPQFPGQTIANYSGQAPFVTGYNQGPYAAGYMPGPNSVFPSQRSAGPSPNQQSYPTFQQQAPPYYYYPTPYGPSSQQHPEMYGTRTNMPHAQSIVSQQGLDAILLVLAEKFFVVKSLTLQDLETSVRTGTWATQAHNEETLNRGYESADNVYLIFSANKSGEYYGYARMASAISDDPSAVTSLVPKPEALDPFDGPKSIPTPATEFAPKGRIIDDSARGTIFWEADLSELEDQETTHEGQISDADRAEAEGSTVGQEWGKPFKIEWISTNRLPFYRTRGLRNPWNANREVKIARDGTELETS